MEKTLLRPLRSDVLYQGQLKAFAWGLFSQPISLYNSLIKHVGKYGVGLKDLKYDSTTLVDANITAFLLDLNTTLRIRLDRLETNFFRLHNIGADVANQMLLDFYAAVQEADPSVEVSQHTLALTVETQVLGTTHRELMQRYFNLPTALRDKTQPGLALYFGADPDQGIQEASLVLDRIPAQEQGLLVKVTAKFDAQQVIIKMLGQRAEEYVTQRLSDLGLALEAEERK